MITFSADEARLYGTVLGFAVLMVVGLLIWLWKSDRDDDEPLPPKPVETVFVKKSHPLAQMPQMMTTGAAGFDLRCVIEPSPEWIIDHENGKEGRPLHPGQSLVFDTGLSFAIPPGFVMLIFSRSGHGFKHSVSLANSVAVIDSDYRGEVKICLRNDGISTLFVEHGERIAQAVIIPRPEVQFVRVSNLGETSRGEDGFGSTGDL